MRCAVVFRRACLILTLGFVPARAQPQASNPVDLGAFTQEIMILRVEGDQQQLAMWMPYEFFVAASMAQSGEPREAIEKEIEFLRPYLTMVVQCGTNDVLGRTDYLPEDAVRARAELARPDGSSVRPLRNVPPRVATVLGAMKATIAAEGDAGSNNMHVLVFPMKDDQGRPIADAAAKGKLTLVLKPHGVYKATSFTWYTPFDALTPEVPCAKCREPLSGKWSFCPYCGAKAPKR